MRSGKIHTLPQMNKTDADNSHAKEVKANSLMMLSLFFLHPPKASEGHPTSSSQCELPTPSLSYGMGFQSDWGMPQLRLASQFWSYFPSTGRDGCSIRLLHSDAFSSDIGCNITISIVMGATRGTIPVSNIKWQLINLVIAIRAELRTREPSINLYQKATFFF